MKTKEKPLLLSLIEEEKELSERFRKLDDFIEKDPAYEFVGDVEWVLLDAQRNAMMSYMHILQHRVQDLICNQ